MSNATREKKIFNDALILLEHYYNDTDWEDLSKHLVEINNYYSTPLWKDLVIAVVEHLERKCKYEQARGIHSKEEGNHLS